ncbi:MAG: hypothetical protein GX297_03510 [Treponema sp.]|nr:hypothetical protein [Treponema sp.]
MSGGRRVLITFIIAFLTSAVFALISHFGLLSVIEKNFYMPMVHKQLEERNNLLSETVARYIDTQDALFTLFSANPEMRSVTSKEQTDIDIKSRANLASNLLTETSGLEGLRIIGENGETLYYSTFPQDFDTRKEDKPISYRNYPKNDIDFELFSVSQESKSRLLNDSENNRLIFSYPFYDSEMFFVGTIAFYVNAPSMLRYFIPTDRLSAESGIFLWSSPNNEMNGFVFSVPVGLENICKKAAISSWTSSEKISSFENSENTDEIQKYIIISAGNNNNYVSTVFKEEILHMPERIKMIIVFATISLIFFISFICVITKNATEKQPSSKEKTKEIEIHAEKTETHSVYEKIKKEENFLDRIDNAFETFASDSLRSEHLEHSEKNNVQLNNDEQQIKNEFFDNENKVPVIENSAKKEIKETQKTNVVETQNKTPVFTKNLQQEVQVKKTVTVLEEKKSNTGLTSEVLSNIDERIHQRKEIIEEYTRPVSMAKDKTAELKHGLLFSSNAYLEKKKKESEAEVSSIPLRKSNLSSIFKEKSAENQVFVQQNAPSNVLTDISNHGLLSKSDSYRSNLSQKSALYTLDLKKGVKDNLQTTDKQTIQSAVDKQQKDKKMNSAIFNEKLEELSPAVETETFTSIFNLHDAPSLFATTANKEKEQRFSFERTGIAERNVEKKSYNFEETKQPVDNIRIENGVYRISEKKESVPNVKINYDFKRLVDSVLKS